MQLKGKVVVITGASRGLGAELAKALAKQGAKLVISARKQVELKQIASETNAVPVYCDVSDEKTVEQLAETAISKFNRIDIWINNVGIWIAHAPIEEVNSDRIKQLIEVNLLGTIYGCKAALRQMKKQKTGAIISILSTSALEGKKGSAAYAASKWGLIGFMKSIRLEAALFGIKVISIYPGGMKTHFFDEQKPEDYFNYMEPAKVAEKVVENLLLDAPEEELILRRK